MLRDKAVTHQAFAKRQEVVKMREFLQLMRHM